MVVQFYRIVAECGYLSSVYRTQVFFVKCGSWVRCVPVLYPPRSTFYVVSGISGLEASGVRGDSGCYRRFQRVRPVYVFLRAYF